MPEQIEAWGIPVNVYRTTDRLTIAAPIPGLSAEDVVVEITADNVLVLHGKPRRARTGDEEVLIDEWGEWDGRCYRPSGNLLESERASLAD